MVIVDDLLDSKDIAYTKDLITVLPFMLHRPIPTYATDADQCMQFAYPVVIRPEEVQEGTSPIKSEYVGYFKYLLELFLLKAGISCNYDILRIAVNATVPSNQEASLIHEDHTYPHKQLIICLNDGFTGGATRIYDEEENLIDRVESKPYRAYMFDSCLHSAEYPISGIRIVAVYTFLMGKEDEARS